MRRSAVTDRADVVLPVAAPVEKSGTFFDWEGRARPFELTLRNTGALHDGRVLHTLAEEMDVDLGVPDIATTRQEMNALGVTSATRPPAPTYDSAPPPHPGAG